jgi:MFS family permease
MAEPAPPLRWYQGLERYCWIVLIVAALGWLFDTMDQNLFTLVRVPSLNEMLHPHPERPELTPDEKRKLADDVKKYGSYVTAIFIVGWATGGWVFGILGDRLGRTKTMIITILIYAIFTGASGLVNDWRLYALMRFLTGLGVGGEWAAGASLVAEVFPERSRPMALGLLQSLSAVGNMLASVITLTIAMLVTEEAQASSWRIAFFVGTVPALLVLWIRASIKEPERWKEAKQQATVGREVGNIAQLFTHPVLRRNTIAAVLMATAGVGALWGIGFFSTDMLRGELQTAGFAQSEINKLVSRMFLIQNAGSFLGIYLFAAFSERFNRRTAFFLWFVLAWASVVAFFWGVSGKGGEAFTWAAPLAVVMGFCTLGPFSGYTIYFPFLFPTRLRATGCGFCYNVARYLAAIAPLTIGDLAVWLGGFAPAATVVSCIYILGFIGTWLGPETKGKPLPEDADFETGAAGVPSKAPAS